MGNAVANMNGLKFGVASFRQFEEWHFHIDNFDSKWSSPKL